MRTIRINRKLCFAALFVGFVFFLVLRNTFKSYDQQILVQTRVTSSVTHPALNMQGQSKT